MTCSEKTNKALSPVSFTKRIIGEYSLLMIQFADQHLQHIVQTDL